MIYTCTVNPSLDYYLNLDHEIKFGGLNRLSFEEFKAGGKGVNVSIVLNNLKIPSTALGFLGGFVRDFYLDFLKSYPFLMPRFTSIEGNTRINIKLNDGRETDFNASGPKITINEFEKFKMRINKIDEGDTFILCGNIQNDLFEMMYEVIKELSQRGVNIVLDTNPSFMEKCLSLKPLLIKPKLEEIEEIVGIIHDEKSLINKLLSMKNKGVKHILLSLGMDGALFIDENNIIYRTHGLKENYHNTTGYEDAMVGAYVFNMQRGADGLECFKYAVASGFAWAYGQESSSRDDIEEYYQKVEVEKLK